jgi:8-amino-7-oxononanoate synthase
MHPLEEELKKELQQLKELNLYRERRIVRGLTVLCSNNYLNLSNHPKVKESAKRAIDKFSTSSGASQLVSGYTPLHKETEQTLQEVKGIPACITVGSGFLANLAILTALLNKEDIVFSDQLNHASIIDGVRLSGAKKIIYPHRDTKTLKQLLETYRGSYRRCVIVSDSVFSMDGDIAPLKELIKLAKTFNCFLVLDDAHATGTIGLSSLHYAGINWESPIVEVGTFSKALGSYGAYICASKVVIEYLVNKARPIIFSTSLPPPALAAAQTSLRLIKQNPSLMEQLQKLSRWVKNELKDLGVDLGLTEDITPIVPLMVYSEERAIKLRDRLLEEGFFVQAIRYPTVEKGKSRLRLTITLEYPKEVYEKFLKVLKRFL